MQQYLVLTTWGRGGACGDVLVPLWDPRVRGLAECPFSGTLADRRPSAIFSISFPDEMEHHSQEAHNGKVRTDTLETQCA
jgi:hypothetical protein